VGRTEARRNHLPESGHYLEELRIWHLGSGSLFRYSISTASLPLQLDQPPNRGCRGEGGQNLSAVASRTRAVEE
jgi:hypothetical protein